jgi:predicted DNA repair protein MutK
MAASSLLTLIDDIATLLDDVATIDDAGLYLTQKTIATAQALRRGLLALAPWLMKTLSVLGTAAMFLLGGGILLHGVPALGHAVDHWTEGLGLAALLVANLSGGMAGLVAGAAVVGVVQLLGKLRA